MRCVSVFRTESVAEKMLTNWFTFLLHRFLKVTSASFLVPYLISTLLLTIIHLLFIFSRRLIRSELQVGIQWDGFTLGADHDILE